MTDTYLLFLNADFILANGSYERLIPHMLRDERVLLAPSYCTVAEQAAPLLAARCDPYTGILTLPPRELAAITLSHRHNTVRAKTINQRLVHFEYMDQCYWDVDADTLLGHQMPISLVAMRPEVALSNIGSFWDWGITYDFCPSQRLTVLGDSDDFLMMELRAEAAHLDLVLVGPTTAEAAAFRMLHITQYQIDVGRFPLTLHSRELLPGAASAHAALQRFVDELSCYLRPKAKEHRNHPDWLYHKERLQRYHEEGLTPKVHHAQTPIPLRTRARAEREAAVARIRELESQVDALSQAASAQVIELQTRARAEREAAVARIRELESQVDALSQAASAQVIELQTRFLSSTSWRITAPLRAAMDRMDRLRRAFKSR